VSEIETRCLVVGPVLIESKPLVVNYGSAK
ncbi:MAG: hypothetical protein RLY79_971, partial [Actinomycetota bacterium]